MSVSDNADKYLVPLSIFFIICDLIVILNYKTKFIGLDLDNLENLMMVSDACLAFAFMFIVRSAFKNFESRILGVCQWIFYVIPIIKNLFRNINKFNFFSYEDFIACHVLFASFAILLTIVIWGWLKAITPPEVSGERNIEAETNQQAVNFLAPVCYLALCVSYVTVINLTGVDNFFNVELTLTNIVLFFAGVITLYWAAKAAGNKAIELTERIKNENFLRRDCALKLISDAAVELKQTHESDKLSIALQTLYYIAAEGKSDPLAPYCQQAFSQICDFVLHAKNISSENKPRLQALQHLNDLAPYLSNLVSLNNDAYRLRSIKISKTGSGIQRFFPNLNLIYQNYELGPNDLSHSHANFANAFFQNCQFVRGSVEEIYIS